MAPEHCVWCGAELMPGAHETHGVCLECYGKQMDMPPEQIPLDELFDAEEGWP